MHLSASCKAPLQHQSAWAPTNEVLSAPACVKLLLLTAHSSPYTYHAIPAQACGCKTSLAHAHTHTHIYVNHIPTKATPAVLPLSDLFQAAQSKLNTHTFAHVHPNTQTMHTHMHTCTSAHTHTRTHTHTRPSCLQPYALHATFQFSGTPGKRHRMREFRLFDDPPEYFDHPVGFMSYNVGELLKFQPV